MHRRNSEGSSRSLSWSHSKKELTTMRYFHQE